MTPLNGKSKTIEIIGPPGTGKSTLYNLLCKSWSPTHPWIYQDALLAPEKPHIIHFVKWIEYKYRILTGKKRAKSIPADFGLRFINNHVQFADLCWNYLNNTNNGINGNLDKRFRSAYFLFTDFCRYQAIEEKAKSQNCLIDEGFLQKSFLVKDSKSSCTRLLEEYLSLVPPPSAIIYINVADDILIKERLRARNKIIASHLGKDDSDLLDDIKNWKVTLDLIASKLHRVNTRIYRVDGEKPIKENVQSILKFLSEI
jgi:thymidylate kinase